MQRLIKRVALFLIPIFAFLAAYEVIMRNIENDYSYKNNWLSDNCNTIELLAIGSSHCYYEINPADFSLNSFNAGHEAQSIKYDYLIFNKFYKEMDSLKYLIVTISYGDPIYFMEDNPANIGTYIKNYAIYYHLPANRIKENFELSNGINIRALLNYFTNGTTLKQCSEIGYYTHPIISKKNWKNDAVDRARLHSINQLSESMILKIKENYNENMIYMNHIINSCRSRGVQVILLTTPIHESYRAHINENEWTLTTNFCHQLVQDFDNVSYINLFQDSRFNDEDFLDSYHLNDNGATKLSLILNDYINENFPN